MDCKDPKDQLHKVSIGLMTPLNSHNIGSTRNCGSTIHQRTNHTSGQASQFITRGDVTGRKTRNSQKLNIPLFKSAAGQKTFYYRIVTLWNGIEEHLKLCSTISSFRYNLRNQLLQDFMQY